MVQAVKIQDKDGKIEPVEFAESKDLNELRKELKAYERRLKQLETLPDSQPKSENTEVQTENPVNPDPVVYKCKSRDCRFSSDDISELMLHTIEAHIPKSEPIKEEPKKMHHTAKEFLECPECFPAFEKEFQSRGYVKKPVESPKEEESLLP